MLIPLILIALAPTSNLAANPNFDAGIFQPDSWILNRTANNRVDWLADRSRPSSCALRLVGCGNDWTGATSRSVPAQPGETVTVAAWVRSQGADPGLDRVYVRAFRNGEFLGQFGPSVPATASDWTLLSQTVTVPSRALTIDFSIQVRSQGTVVIGAAGFYRGDVTNRIADLLAPPAITDMVPVTTPRGMPPDANHNGLPDALEKALGVPGGSRSLRRIGRNTTCFQTQLGYVSEHDIKVDTVLMVNPTREAIGSWKTMGYRTPFMAGFRADATYLAEHPGSAQMDRSGRALDCSPGSYYMVPSADRQRVMRELFRTAAANGAEGAAPEEPEFFSTGAYSPVFKQAFQTHYGRPWIDPETSPQARADCQRLMGDMEIELLRACYEGATAGNPRAKSWMLVHSPVNYFAWAFAFPFNEAVRKLKVDNVVAQVWTGTAQCAVNHEGIRKSRLFENAYLEYSSALNLVRGKGIPMWLLMDPLEDMPGRPMVEYFDGYKRTLAAALMFPETSRYEVMPWPSRIFGQVPADFATVIGNVVNMLGDMHGQRGVRRDQGSDGIATFLGDSAMWQRSASFASDIDGLYGLSLPLLERGVPAQVAYLDRAAEPGYLKPYRVLLLSFDMMKPLRRTDVDAIVSWVHKGGQLLVFGGQDAYNDLNMWWKRDGYASPHAYLLKALGLNPATMVRSTHTATESDYRIAATTNYAGRALENRAEVTVDLTGAIAKTGSAYVKFEDSIPADGWGPLISGFRLVGTRAGTPVDIAVKPGTPAEADLVEVDTGSGVNNAGRFVDADRKLVYRVTFDKGCAARMIVDVGNQYRISVAQAPAQSVTALRRSPKSPWAASLDPAGTRHPFYEIAYRRLGARPVLEGSEGTVIAEKTVGKGGVIVCGLPPAHFAQSPAADGMLRGLVRHAYEQTGAHYREQEHIGIRRGNIEVVKTLDAPLTVKGPFIDMMTADLKVLPSITLPRDSVAILMRLPKQTGLAPVIAACSDRVEWKVTSGNELRVILSSGKGIRGAMRLVTGGRPVTVRAFDAFGRAKTVRVIQQGPTMLLRFNSEPLGLGLRIRTR